MKDSVHAFADCKGKRNDLIAMWYDGQIRWARISHQFRKAGVANQTGHH